MLLLFALSITPKQLLHDVITGHKHNYTKSGEITHYQAAKNNFQCNWQEQLVESPFVDEPAFRIENPPVVFSSYTNHYSPSYNSAEVLFTSLRGPPSRVA